MRSVDSASITSLSARERLVDSAVELFATRGFHAIGLRDLASYAGLQAGSLYHYIENKQSLLFELIESAWSDLLLTTKQRMHGAKTPSERVHRFVQAFVSFTLNEKYRLILVTREFVNLNEEYKQPVDQLKSTYRSLLYDTLADEHGVKRQHDEKIGLITNAVMGMLYGQLQWNEENIAEHRLIDLLTECILRMIETRTEEV